MADDVGEEERAMRRREREIAREAHVDRAIEMAERERAERRARRKRCLEEGEARLAAKEARLLILRRKLEETAEFAADPRQVCVPEEPRRERPESPREPRPSEEQRRTTPREERQEKAHDSEATQREALVTPTQR